MAEKDGFDFSVPQLNIADALAGVGDNGGNTALGGFNNNILAQSSPSIGGATSALPGDISYGLLGATGVDGETTQFGLLDPALSAIGGGFGIYQGLKQLGQAEDALDFQKDSFKKNFAASKAAFQERLRGNYGRKATLGGNKGTTEKEYVDTRSDF